MQQIKPEYLANRLKTAEEAKAESQHTEFQQAKSAEHAATLIDDDEQNITERVKSSVS
ncbi:MAG: hypothetical protein EXX96DRAFT_619922 [Benjaminiella poitrasii]|nr:MAG: hypothetical protein EXX96DRAFT_619922 [Benjaminiella poitrasii]